MKSKKTDKQESKGIQEKELKCKNSKKGTIEENNYINWIDFMTRLL